MPINSVIRPGRIRVQAKRLQRRVDRGARRAMAKQAFDVRNASVDSILRAPTPNTHSTAGMPPFWHLRIFQRSIRYAYDRFLKTYIVGFIKFSSKGVPRALELGGVTTAARGGRYVQQRIQARPTLVPALRKTARGFVRKFRNILRS